MYEPEVYTVESVLQGHPDKVCDQVADALLDAFLQADPEAKVGVECMGCGNQLHLGGEVRTDAQIEVKEIAHQVCLDIGYRDCFKVANYIQTQSDQLGKAVDSGAAGDQGIMYGFASRTFFNYLPYGVFVVNAIAREIDALRHRTGSFLPDGKVQVTIRQGAIETLVISVQHTSDADIEALRQSIIENAVRSVVPVECIPNVMFNHCSSFLSGGFANDTGLTGRKQAADTYGGLVPHGGGSFSGKDPSKVDRSASYMARFVAKNIVANDLADHCLVAVAYAFGKAEPVMLDMRTDNPMRNSQLINLVKERFDFQPSAIIERLNLKSVSYRPTATYGNFTDSRYPWERIEEL